MNNANDNSNLWWWVVTIISTIVGIRNANKYLGNGRVIAELENTIKEQDKAIKEKDRIILEQHKQNERLANLMVK